MSMADLYGDNDDDSDWEIADDIHCDWSLEDFQKHPLFMQEIPTDDKGMVKVEGNEHLEGLQALLYHGETPESLAELFKKNGNEQLKKGKKYFKDAVLYYSRGLAEGSSDNKVNSVLHSNRAQVYLLKSLWPKVVDDCKKAIELDETNVKAYYRAAKASFQLELWQQAADFATNGLKQEGGNVSLLQLLQSAQEKMNKRDQKRAKSTEEKKAAQDKAKADLANRLKEQNIKTIAPMYDMPEYMDTLRVEDDAVLWPAVLLYDECGQTDFIENFDEDSYLEDHLKVILPGTEFAEWDHRQRYKYDGVVGYLETDAGMQLIDPIKPIRDVLANHTVPRILPIHVMVKDSACLKDFLERHTIL